MALETFFTAKMKADGTELWSRALAGARAPSRSGSLKLQDRERALFEAALGDAGATGGALTREDLLELFA